MQLLALRSTGSAIVMAMMTLLILSCTAVGINQYLQRRGWELTIKFLPLNIKIRTIIFDFPEIMVRIFPFSINFVPA